LNGVGGKIEPDETSVQAMHREWAEETKTGPQDWTEFCYLSGDTYKVVFFKATTENLLNLPFPNKNDVGEYFQTFYIDDIHTFNVVPNLLWLIPMAFKDPANPKASLVLDTVRGKG
jgi:8-oxo-dGTP pyrophosphatase MutT (NUDIX family)